MNATIHPASQITTDLLPAQCAKKETWLDYTSRLATIAMSSATGYALHGNTGALAGGVASIVDECFRALKLSEKHYLTSTLFWTASVLAPMGSLASKYYSLSSSFLELSAYLAGGLGLSYLFDDFFNLDVHIRSPLRSIAQANSLFHVPDIHEKKQISRFRVFSAVQDYFNNTFLTSITKKIAVGILSITTEYLFLKFLSSYDLQTYGVKILHDKSLSKFKDFNCFDVSQWKELSPEVTPLALDALKIFSGLVLKNQIVWGLRKYRRKLGHQQHSLVMDKVTQCLLQKGRGSELLAEEDGAELLHHMNNDFSRLMYEGVQRLDSFVENAVTWIFSLATLHQIVPGVLSGYLFSTWPLQRSYESMIQKIKDYGQIISKASTELSQIKEDISKNMGQIELRDGTEYLNEQYNEALKQYNKAEADLARVKADWDQSTQLHDFYHEVITYASFALAVAMKGMTLSDLALYKKSANHVVKSLSGNLTILNTDSNLNLSQQRIEQLITILQRPLPERVERKESLDGSIQIQDYHLYLKDQELLHIPNLNLKPGKVYSVTGHSGCGKSTFLKDLKQGILGKLKSRGTFYLPNSLLFIDQDVYLPPNRTLFETICFPTPPTQLRNFETVMRKQAILNLFEELQINHDQDDTQGVKLADLLDSKEFQLSGGQRKKIALIQAILQKPKVLIMDEGFTGLDPFSLGKAKEVIKKYLPETLIISVDHHAFEDKNSFYHHNIHFENGQVRVR